MSSAQLDAPEKEKALDLSDISQLGRIEKTKEVLKGVSVTLQTLSASHQQKILAALPSEKEDPLGRYAVLQMETLTYATVAINGKTYADNDRGSLRAFYSGLQNKILQEIYSFYTQLMEEQNTVIDGLKKT